MFERFTKPARHVVVLAQEEARRLDHNYIGTEHLLLGLMGEPEGIAYRALERYEVSLDGARAETVAITGTGDSGPTGHIPFTPRAKKTLELALREALQLHHNYIGTEHILLGIIREGDGVGAQILRQHSADLSAIRTTVLDLLAAGSSASGRGPRWQRRHSAADLEAQPGLAETKELRTTPAADSSLSEAARLAGLQPVGSHHLLLAALSDPDTAAARALAELGVDLERAMEALRAADVTGTSDEQPAEAGRRQLVIRVADDGLTVEARDPRIIERGKAALHALGDQADPPGTIRGDLTASTGLGSLWQALYDGLESVRQHAARLPVPGEVRPRGGAGRPAETSGNSGNSGNSGETDAAADPGDSGQAGEQSA
jgi:ATP-dependent Clp protease ATP-binding subunit ClpC